MRNTNMTEEITLGEESSNKIFASLYNVTKGTGNEQSKYFRSQMQC